MKLRVRSIITIILALVLSLAMIIPASAADLTVAGNQAAALKELSLFKGVSDTDFDLDRAPTRTEALVMLVRSLGQEAAALNGSWTHPFTDVAAWADKYVGYAYENGLTKGVSETQFGTGNAGSDMYLTFMLRALGYDDAAGDFTWNEPETLATSAGILPDGVDTTDFLRADVVLVSWAALDANMKDGSQTLSGKLIAAGVFSSDDYTAAKLTAAGNGSTATVSEPAYTYETADGIASVSSFAEFKGALLDSAVTEVEIIQDLNITEDLTLTKPLTVIEHTVNNSAVLTVKALITLGGAIIENSGSIVIGEGGFLGVYMTEFNNRGQLTVEAAGKVEIDRGGQFKNFATLTNNGLITVTSNGGSLSNEGSGNLINNGEIDCTGYYHNYGTYSGTGTEPVGI